MKFPFLVPLLVIAGVVASHADYVIDVDLGILPIGDTVVSGTTAQTQIDPGPPPVTIGGNDNSVFLQGFVNPGLNWGNEIVYQFTLAQPSIITITKSSGFTGDPDFFLLDGLTTAVDATTGKIAAQDGVGFAFLDGAIPESATLGTVREGIYYLSVEHYNGADGAVVSGDGIFSVTINILDAIPVDLAIDVGAIGVAGAPLNFDTFGSNFNTELAIYDLFGTLLHENDDAGGGPQSEISIPGGLLEGAYYAVLAGNDVIFDPGPLVSTGGAVGDYVVNYLRGSLAPGLQTGTTTAGSETQETQWFRFSIEGLPDPVIDLGTIANANEPFQINSFSNDLTFDTQLALYDSAGALTAENDDANGTLQSVLDFPGGLAPGTWFVALGGYPTFFGNFFFVTVNTNINTISEGGPYMLNHPLGIVDEAIVSSRHQWFQFEVAPPPTLPSIDITSIAFNPATNEFTLSWETSLPGPFNIFMGTAAEFAALQPAPNNVLPTAAAAGVISPVTIPVPGGLQGAPQLLLQVTD
jgi:hypothetical protein